MTKPVLALFDFDDVLNSFSKSLKKSGKGKSFMVDKWPVTYRPEVVDKVKELLSLPHVTGGWHTTWLWHPDLLDEVEEEMGLTGLFPVRAAHPTWTQPETWKTRYAVEDGVFDGAVDYEKTPKWWKYRSLELLADEYPDHRLLFADDSLALGTGRDFRWALGSTYEKHFVRPDRKAALLLPEAQAMVDWALASPEDFETV